MELTMEQAEQKLKNDLYKVMATLEKCVPEKDLRKAYRDITGQNVNIAIQNIQAGNVLHFLRFKCRDFCEVDKLDGVRRVHRLFETENDEPKCHKKKQKSNAAPKLNFPRIGLINSTTFPRLNPQGFNKGKTNKEGKSLTTLPYYQPKYSIAYRSAADLNKFKENHATSDQELFSDEEQSYIYDRSYAEAVETDAEVTEPSVPKVKNPNDFPSLPTKKKNKEKPAGQDSNVDFEKEEQSIEAEEDQEEEEVQSSIAAAEKVLDDMKNLRMHKNPSVSNSHAELDLDDPIFRFEFPSVVTDPLFNIPNPEMKILEDRVFFEINLTVIYSPAQFWFQYGDASLYILMNRLKAFYSNLSDKDLYMSESTMKPGLVVAAKVLTSWHRAQIVSGPNMSDGQVSLFFLDFGVCDLVPKSNIRYLLKTFTDTPVKALRGSTVGVSPANAQTWSYSARKAFFEVVANKKLFASIRLSRNDFKIYKLELTDQINSNMRIAQHLIRLGLAVSDKVDDENITYALPMPIAAKNPF